MPWYNKVKAAITGGVGIVGGYLGQVVVPAYIAPVARTAGEVVFKYLAPKPAGLIGKAAYSIGMKSFAEGCGYQVFRVAATYGGVAGGVIGVAATHLAFKGIEYGAEYLTPHVERALNNVYSYFSEKNVDKAINQENIQDNWEILSGYKTSLLQASTGQESIVPNLRASCNF